MKKILAAIAVLVGMSGSVAAQPPSPYPTPPPMYREAVPRQPSRHVIWQPGHWQWNGVGYVWVRGQYVKVRPQQHRWVQGHWRQSRGGWQWVEPHWE